MELTNCPKLFKENVKIQYIFKQTVVQSALEKKVLRLNEFGNCPEFWKYRLKRHIQNHCFKK